MASKVVNACYFNCKCTQFILYRTLSTSCTSQRQVLRVDSDFEQRAISGEAKTRRHPGIWSAPSEFLPPQFNRALLRTISNYHSAYPLKQLNLAGEKLQNQLWHRHLPWNDRAIRKLAHGLEDEYYAKHADDSILEVEDYDRLQKDCEQFVNRRLSSKIYHWTPMIYDTPFKCLSYLYGRTAAEYAIVRRVFHEIKVRCVNFRPTSVFDFGSGIGTTIWACENVWSKGTVKEYFCVDTSTEMNNLSQLLLQDGDRSNCAQVSATLSFKPYLPVRNDISYDLVVSAFSLFELPSYAERMATVANLWQKTSDFLVLVENGTRDGYHALLEARDFILAAGHTVDKAKVAELPRSTRFQNPDTSAASSTSDQEFAVPTYLPQGYVFAPCPHDLACPRVATESGKTPCNFSIKYFPLSLTDKRDETLQKTLFSYIVLRKGQRADDSAATWPRLVAEPKISHHCVNCHLCTADGLLHRFAVRKRASGNVLYRSAKASAWGDSLPVSIVDATDDVLEISSTEECPDRLSHTNVLVDATNS